MILFIFPVCSHNEYAQYPLLMTCITYFPTEVKANVKNLGMEKRIHMECRNGLDFGIEWKNYRAVSTILWVKRDGPAEQR